MARVSAEAKAPGAELLGLERDLGAAFATSAIDDQRLRDLTAEIDARQGALRAVHLAAHLETAAALSAEQIARYGVLRGYAGGSSQKMNGHSQRH